MKNFGTVIDNFDAVTKQYVDNKVPTDEHIKGIKVDNATSADTAKKVKNAFTYKAHNKTAGTVVPITYDGSEAASLDFSADDFAYDYSSGKDITVKLSEDVKTSLGKADSALQSAPVTSVNGKTGDVTGLATKDEVNAKQNALTETQLAAVNSGITEAKRTKYDGYEEIINQKANSADLATVATSGSYNDVSNIPVINQDLTASGFTPVANTYYRHTGATTASYTNGVIYYYNGTGYAALDGSGSGGGGGSTAVTEQVTVAADDWVLDCTTYKQVPVNPIENGDSVGVLCFDTTKTPDFSAINAVLSENEDFGLSIISNAGSRSNPYNPELHIAVRSFRAGRTMNGTAFTSRQWGIEYYKRSPDEEVDTYFYATDELSTALGFAASGWQTARFIDMDTLFVKNTENYFSNAAGRGFFYWDEYISKDGKWEQVPVGSSTIPPFTYRASKTLSAVMGANSAVSLGYSDSASMRECASAGVAIGEVPTDSGNGIIFYSVTKPTQAVNLVVEISETTTNA